MRGFMNEDQKLRDEIIFGRRKPKYLGGSAWFECMSLEKLKQLVDLGFANKRESQNYGPTIEEMLDFADENPELEMEFDGYAIDGKRDDYRVTIDAVTIYFNDADFEQRVRGIEFVRCADEFSLLEGSVYGWWD